MAATCRLTGLVGLFADSSSVSSSARLVARTLASVITVAWHRGTEVLRLCGEFGLDWLLQEMLVAQTECKLLRKPRSAIVRHLHPPKLPG